MDFSRDLDDDFHSNDVLMLCEHNTVGFCGHIQNAVSKTGSNRRMSGAAALIMAVGVVIFYDLASIYREVRLTYETWNYENRSIKNKFIFRIFLRLATTASVVTAITGVGIGSLPLAFGFALGGAGLVIFRNLINCYQIRKGADPETLALSSY